MKIQDRKEKAFLHKALIDILTDCPDNDMAYLKRLILAQEIITNEIERFTNEEYMNVIMELQKGQSNLTISPAKNFFQPLDFFLISAIIKVSPRGAERKENENEN